MFADPPVSVAPALGRISLACSASPRLPATQVAKALFMEATTMELGKPETVLRLGPSTLREDADWTQDDSDTLAHFIQVHKQIAQSSWRKANCRFTSVGGEVTDSTFPGLESFVYVAVYFRQLLAQRDQLFVRACDCYAKSVASPAKGAWVTAEKNRCLSSWGSPTFFIKEYSTQDLFDAFLYGTYLLHSVSSDWKKSKRATQQRRTIRDILDRYEPSRTLFQLHGSLRILFNYVSHVAAVTYQDFAQWVNNGHAPRPDIMWHDAIFKP